MGQLRTDHGRPRCPPEEVSVSLSPLSLVTQDTVDSSGPMCKVDDWTGAALRQWTVWRCRPRAVLLRVPWLGAREAAQHHVIWVVALGLTALAYGVQSPQSQSPLLDR